MTDAHGARYNNLLPLEKNPYPFQYDMFGSKKVVEIQQLFQFGIGAVLWDCEIVLATYLTKVDPKRWNGTTVIELGAGTGLAAIVAWQLGAFAVATDLKDVVDAATIPNVLRNSQSADKRRRAMLHAAVLSWGVTEEAAACCQLLPKEAAASAKGKDKSATPKPPAYDYIIAADVIYHSDQHPILLQTMVELASPTTVLIFVHRRRFENDSNFLEPLLEAFDVIKTTPVAEIVPTYPKQNLIIYEFRRKAAE